MFKKKIGFSLIGGLIILFLAVPTFAASSDFFPQAQEVYSKYCASGKVLLKDSIGCYVFDKVQELQNRLDDLETADSDQVSQIDELSELVSNLQTSNDDLQNQVSQLQTSISSLGTLEEKIDSLETSNSDLENRVESLKATVLSQEGKIDQLETIASVPAEEFSFFNWSWHYNGDESQVLDFNNRKLMVIKGVTQYGDFKIDLLYSDDQTNWTYQDALNIEGIRDKEYEKAVAIKGRYYKVRFNYPRSDSVFGKVHGLSH